MSARDDFELLKRAVMFDADTDERCGFKDDAEATRKAFHRLFTPRPLSERVSQGWECVWVKAPGLPWSKMILKGRFSDLMQDYPAIPIITPEDMGAG